MKNICIFEDEGYKDLYPLTYMRPVYGLRCGMTILLEKILRQYPATPFDLNCRNYLLEIVRRSHLIQLFSKNLEIDQTLLLNGRILASANLSKKIPLSGDDEIFTNGKEIIAARISGVNLRKFREYSNGPLTDDFFDQLLARRTEVFLKLINYPWELVEENDREIVEDFKALAKGGRVSGDVHPMVAMYEKQNIFVGEGAEILATAVLDASDGPIYIGKDALIFPHTFIEGPAYIGEKSIILGGKIRSGTSIGPSCKVEGEVSRSIIHGYSNKSHYGFLGNSYICEWVNLGAGTVTSNLKNNYSHVKVKIGGQDHDTTGTFVGSFIGDHSKTGIGTLLSAGTIIGVSSNIFGNDLQPKYLPSFSWGSKEKLEEYNIEKAINTARIVMSRRNIEITAIDELLLHKVFELTAEDRRNTIKAI